MVEGRCVDVSHQKKQVQKMLAALQKKLQANATFGPPPNPTHHLHTHVPLPHNPMFHYLEGGINNNSLGDDSVLGGSYHVS